MKIDCKPFEYTFQNNRFLMQMFTIQSPDDEIICAVVDDEPGMADFIMEELQKLNDFEAIFNFFKENCITILSPAE